MKTIQLIKPVTKGAVTLSELVFQEPKTAHIMAVDGKDDTTAAFVVSMTSALTGGTPEILLKELCPEDYAQIQTEVRLIYARYLRVSPSAVAEVLAASMSIDDFSGLVRAFVESRGIDQKHLFDRMQLSQNPHSETTTGGLPSPS